MLKKINIKANDFAINTRCVIVINIVLAFEALLKDLLLASYLGTSSYSDSFMLAFFITDMIGNNLIANAIATGSIPIFSRIFMEEDETILYKTVNKLIKFFLISTIFLILTLYLFRTKIIHVLASGFSQYTFNLCNILFVIMLPTIVLYPIVFILISYFQIHEKFTFSAFLPVIFNGIFLLGTAFCYINEIEKIKGIYIISYTVLLSVLITLICAIIYRNYIFDRKSIEYIKNQKVDKNLIEVLKLSIPYLVILLLTQGMLYFERKIASNFQAGSISALNYAFRLSQFPIWVFVSAIIIVNFPLLSKLISIGDEKNAKKNLFSAIWLAIILTTPLMLLLFILKEPIISILFLRNAFDNNSLLITLEIFSTYCFVILGQSITTICIKYYLALKDVKTPIKILIVSFIINIVIDIYASKYIGLYSLGLGAALANTLSAILFIYTLKLNMNSVLKDYKSRVIKLIFLNLIMIFILILNNIFYNNISFYWDFVFKLIHILITISISFLLYLFCLYKLKLI